MRARLAIALALMLFPAFALAQEDVADVSSQDLHVAGNEKQRYFLIGGKADAKAPAKGYALLIVLPGGDGSADFNAFVRRIYKNALPEDFLIAQLVAVSSDRKNQIVWPTEKTRDAKQAFSTESFIAGVLKDVKAKRKIDDTKVYTLSWSSGGPAAYAASLAKDSPITGSYIAMSVFMQQQLPPLAAAKGKSYFLLQSPDDQVTRYFFAKTAKSQLEKAGANVTLKDYAGGHGWQGDVYGNIREGIDWLIANPSTSAKGNAPGAGDAAGVALGPKKKPATQQRRRRLSRDSPHDHRDRVSERACNSVSRSRRIVRCARPRRADANRVSGRRTVIMRDRPAERRTRVLGAG